MVCQKQLGREQLWTTLFVAEETAAKQLDDQQCLPD